MGNVRYWLAGKGRGESSAKLIYVSSSIYEGDWFSMRHSHNFAELFYVRSGRGNFIVEDEIYPVQQDDLVIVNPNVEHTEVSVSTDPLEYVVLGVEDMSFGFGKQSSSRNHEIINCRNQRHEFLTYFNTMLWETENKKEDYEAVCQNLLEIVIINLVRSSGHPISIVTTQRADKVCSRIKRYIESNYAEEISLQSLAEKAHISKYYLAHSFVKNYGMSPINYLNEVRIRASKELMQTTDLSIAQIAEITGFSSQSYFSQSFRRCCGLKPSDYRLQTKKEATLAKS